MLTDDSGCSDDSIQHVCTMKLESKLNSIRNVWTLLGLDCWGIITNRPAFVDVSTAPSMSLLWYRTTLVRRGDEWHLVEHNQFISDLVSMNATIPNPKGINAVMTLGHAVECTQEQLGFHSEVMPLDLLTPSHRPVPASGETQRTPEAAQPGPDAMVDAPMQPVSGNPDMHPVAADEPVDDPAPAAGPDEITIDGSRINASSSLVLLKAACDSLGLSKSGNRSQLFKRIVGHVKHQELLTSHSIKHKIASELQRPVIAPGVPAEPTEHERREHAMTHIPYRAWCDLRVAHKGRQDQHHVESHATSAHSVVSFDFGYCSRKPDESDSQTVLFIHDRSTKWMHAVPTEQKAGRCLKFLASEVCRVVTWAGHTSVCFRCDNEPSTLAILETAKKVLISLGIATTTETIVPGNKPANGAAEATVQAIRNQANLLVNQIEKMCGAGDQIIFSANHPVYQWSIVHASFLHNRFNVTQGETPYERASSREYTGRLCTFGEQVMGYLNPKVKGLMFPWTPREPEIGAEQLAEIDNLAELVEVMRLKSLGVLLPPEQVGSDNPKMLSTKFVITWRDKTIDGKRCWLRRARKVAREFNWLSEREDLFSPASSSVTSKLLPALYLHLKDQNPNIRYTMASADITDAFLTVPQKQPTLVKYGSQ